MLKFYIACLLLASLLREKVEVCGLTSAFNACPGIIITTVQINSLPSSNFSSLATTSALSTAQPDNSYQAIATFQHLALSQTDSQISIGILISAKSSSSIDINITGSKGGAYITILKVIYLIVSSQYSSNILAFTAEFCLTPYCQNTQSYPGSSTITFIQEFTSPLSPGANKIVAFFSSFSLMKVTGTSYGLSVDANNLNATHYEIVLNNPSSQVKIGYFLISVIAYHQSTSLQIISITIDQVSFMKIHLTTSSPANTFHGLYLFVTTHGQLDFTISSVGNTMNNEGGSDMYRLKQNTITFGPCCAPTPYILKNQSMCADACPPRTYVQINTVNCLSCASDCYTCINSATCTSCNLTIDSRQLNSTTGRCDLVICVYPNCCGSTPIIDPVLLACVASCSARTFVNNNTMSCLPCAYDCYTCDNNATCLTCNATTDYRQLNSTTGRCDPMINYYDTGVTVAANCSYPNCCGSSPYIDNSQSTCASCPPRTYLQNNTINCIPCAYDCYTCNNNSTCLTCDNSTDKRQFNSTTNKCDPIHNYYESGVTVAVPCAYPNCCGDAPIIFTNQSSCVASCPTRRYLDTSTMDCLLCAYDCYNCTNNSSCIACDNSTDHRQFNSTTNRCDPIHNYYDPGTTTAVLCSYPNCCGDSPIIFTAQLTCVASCPVRRYLQNNTMDCLPCAYDCYNCTSNVTCTSCDNSTDHRQYNSATSRCDPIHNYYDSGVTTAVLCSYPNCCGDAPIIFTAQSSCVAYCPARRYLQINTMDCLLCTYDCYNCTNNSSCIACENSTDHRSFNSTTNRCDPIRNYYDSGATIAVLCSYPNCCGDAPIIFRNQSVCASSCPIRTYLDNNTMDCLPCVYDCYNCTNHVNCTSCDNATDHRQFNPATERCIPIYNYYDPGSTVALPCSYPKCCGDFPIIYTAQSICTDSCPVRTYLQPSVMDCFLCAYDCYTCSIPTICTSCNSSTDYRQFNYTTGRCNPILNYFESGNTVAAKCTYPNCCGTSPIKFSQNYSCLSSCPKNYTLNTTSKTCSHCDSGFWPVSNLCTNIAGCKAAKLVNQTIVCLLCDSSTHYTLSNNTCICSQGYIFSTEGCKEVCGDGYHFSEKCDDGNFVNGDGCSSLCIVETLFRCSSTSSIQPSKCQFVGNSIQFSLNWVNKTAGKNQGVFSFRVTARYVRLNLTKVFVNYNFTSEPTPTSIRITTTENQLLLYADYDENLEGNMAKLSLEINPDYIVNVKNLSVTFRMSSVGSKLVVLYNYPTISLLSQVIKILSYVVIGVFLGSSLAYKMIGVEIMHSFLVVYFICLATTNQTEPYIIFTLLNLININFEKYSSNFYSSNIAPYYRIQDEFLSKLTLFLSLFLPLLIFGVLKIALFFSKTEKDDKSNKTSNAVRMMQYAQTWLYEVLLFPLSIGYLHYSLFPAFLAKTSTSNSQYFHSNVFLILWLKVFLMVFCSTVFFTVFKAYFTSRQQNSQASLKKGVKYANVYFFFWLQVVLIFSINCFFKLNWLEEYIFLIYLRFIFMWPCYRPYHRSIHNFGQFLNLFMVIIFLGWSIARKYFSMLLDEQIQIQIIYGVLLLMFVSVLITTIRTCIQLKYVWSSKNKNEKKQGKKAKKQVKNVDQDKFEGILEVENKYRLQNMLINKKKVGLDCQTLQTDQIDACIEINKNIKSRYSRKANLRK